MPPDPSRSAVQQVLGAAVLFGTTGTAQALGPTGTTPLGVGAIRLVVGGAGLLAVQHRLGGSAQQAVRLWRTRWGLTAGIMTAAYQICFFAAVSLSGVALGTLVTIGSGPVFAGMLSWLLLRERPTRVWVVATLVCVAGLSLLTLDGVNRSGAATGGLVLALLSGLGYALYTVASKRLMNAGHASHEVMAAAFGLGGLILIPVLLSQPLSWLWSWQGVALAVWLGLATTTVAYVLFGRGLAVLPAGPVTTLVLAEPLVATVLGVLVLGERLGPAGWAGCLLVLAGLVLLGGAEVRADRGESSS